MIAASRTDNFSNFGALDFRLYRFERSGANQQMFVRRSISRFQPRGIQEFLMRVEISLGHPIGMVANLSSQR